MGTQPNARYGMVDGLPVIVRDGLMSEAANLRLFQWLCDSPFTRDEVARPDTQAFRHWALGVTPEECKRLPLYAPTERALQADLAQRGPQRLYRAYCNLCAYGDMLFTHTDSQPGREGLTALWYICPRWDVEWGGETLLFNADGDAEFVVSPRPGRLLLFDARIRHAGRPPNRICVLPRLTFALKFEPAASAPAT